MYLIDSDQNKYRTVINGLHSKKALDNNQYPKTIIETNNVLCTYQFDNAKENKYGKEQNKQNNEEDKNTANNKDEKPPLSFVRLEGKCYCCGKPGHKSPQCYMKNKIPREEWAINKTQMAHVRNYLDNKDKDNKQP